MGGINIDYLKFGVYNKYSVADIKYLYKNIDNIEYKPVAYLINYVNKYFCKLVIKDGKSYIICFKYNSSILDGKEFLKKEFVPRISSKRKFFYDIITYYNNIMKRLTDIDKILKCTNKTKSISI